VILAAAPTPGDAARLTRSQLRALLKRVARPRHGVEAEIERLREVFRADYLHQLPQAETAMGYQAAALIQQLDAACNSVDQLAVATEEAFFAHPDADIITSFPGLSVLSGARILAEPGDDRERCADARAMKAYAGAAPVTRASGRSHVVVARTAKNQRLAAAGYMWAFAALRTEAPRAHYDRRRASGERHTSTLRNLLNKLLGCLYHCLQAGTLYEARTRLRRPRDAGRMTIPGTTGAESGGQPTQEPGRSARMVSRSETA
jgi:transposase